MNHLEFPDVLSANHASYPHVTPSEITTEQWLTYWQRLRVRALEPTSAQRLRYVVRLINAVLGSIPLQRLNHQYIQYCIGTLLDQGVSPRVVRSSMLYFSEAMDIAKKRHLLGYNPCASMILPSITNPVREAHFPDELTPLFEAAIDTELENLLPVAMYAALRAGEALALSWRRVDFLHKCIIIDQSYREYYNEEKQKIREIRRNTKNGRHRTIYPPECTFSYLERQKQYQEEQMQKAGPTWQNPENLVFTTSDGKQISSTRLKKKFSKLRKTAGLPTLCFHDLRHTGALLRYNSTHDLWAVKDYLDHRFLGTTLRYIYYNRIDENDIQKLDDFYKQFLR